MALPVHFLDNFPQHLRKAGLLRVASDSCHNAEKIEQPLNNTGTSSLHRLILEGELPSGGVTELCSEGGSAFTTTIALRACQRLQQQSLDLYGESSWCAFLDPSRSLYAPGVEANHVDLKRLLVVRPQEEVLHRVALRLVEAQVFPLVVIDTAGFFGSPSLSSLAPWVRVLRRLSSFLAGSSQSVLLLTQKSAPRPLPLPVFQRIELSRLSESELSVKVPKSIHGIYSGPLRIAVGKKLIRQAS